MTVLSAGCLLICSCADDMNTAVRSSHQISFIPEVHSHRETSTRTPSEGECRSGVFALRAGGKDFLFLHTTCADSIATEHAVQAGTDGVTRAAPVSGQGMYDSFGLSAYAYKSSWDETDGPNYIYDVSVNRTGDVWTPASACYWPGKPYKMRFFAYAPRGEASYRLSGQSEGRPALTCVVPADVSEQKDLLVAVTEEVDGASGMAVPLTFRHAMTAVRFACADDMRKGTVKSITLRNVYSKGVYDMDRASWSGLDSLTAFRQVLDMPVDKDLSREITTDAQTFMMIPQRLAGDAEIEVVFHDGKTEHTLKAVIADGLWPMGATVTYNISAQSIRWEYVLEVTSPEEFTYQGGSGTYTLTSYREDADGNREPVPWTAVCSTDGGEHWSQSVPSWLRGLATSGQGNVAPTVLSVAVSPQTEEPDGLHRHALMQAPPKGGTRPYNLSNATGAEAVENTANCYVVDASGWYSFPLVYGNAIKNGQTNRSAYTSKASTAQESVLSPFINHLGVGIVSPYISANPGCVPAKAELLWQDAPGLVGDVRYNPGENGGNVTFRVENASICQGNAVIAVKDAAGAVLWSWHIWVTDEHIRDVVEITNYSGRKFALMPVNLGWCDVEAVRFDERTCIVKVMAGEQAREIVWRQNGHKVSTAGNNPFYQWGRKDPFCPSTGKGNVNATLYTAAGTAYTSGPRKEDLGSDKTCIKNYILKPDVMQANVNGDNKYVNLWSADNTTYVINDNSNRVVKTVYDPCPPGFMMSPGNAFTGFSKTGENVVSSSAINGQWDAVRMGWHFYVDESARSTVFFPTPGWRSTQRVVYVRSYGFYWLAVPQASNYGRYLSIDRSDLYPYFNATRSYGMSVRPCRE